jgi:transportin-3
LQHLVPFVGQLHTFIVSVGPRLAQEDKNVVYEAIAHVISAMPMEDAAQMLRTFALDLLQSVMQLATKTAVYTKQELKAVCGECRWCRAA